MAIKFEDHPFWDSACALYGRDGVSRAVIALQDRHRLDVNILLLCIWLGQSGRGALDAGAMAHALAVSDSWNPEIVCGLRALRIRLRNGLAPVPRALSDAVRKRILAVEIEAEHAEQLALVGGLAASEDGARPTEARLADCIDSLSRYLAARRGAPAPADADDLAIVLTAAFPELAADGIRARCAAAFAPTGGA